MSVPSTSKRGEQSKVDSHSTSRDNQSRGAQARDKRCHDHATREDAMTDGPRGEEAGLILLQCPHKPRHVLRRPWREIRALVVLGTLNKEGEEYRHYKGDDGEGD